MKQKFTKIYKDLASKLFKTKKNTFISILALIQCVVLLGITTFSWIESSSSLIIKGDNLPIGDNINYRFDIVDGATNMVDLSTYFRPTALYQMAQASTSDGNNFYFKKQSSGYRKGDTTDYNTSYYNIDFQVHNTTSKSYNYYFDKADIFTVTSDNDTLTEADLNTAAGAFRIAVTAGTNTTNTSIYSRDSVTYAAIGNTTGTTVQTKPLALVNSNYIYNGNNDASSYVFTSTNGGDDTRVNLKIWFEEKDPNYQALSADKKTAILGATVSINLKFVNSASNFQTFFFDDYTFSVKEGHEGKNITTEDQTNKVYLHYSDGTTTSVIPMAITTSPYEGVTRWVTASDEGEPIPRIPDDIRQDLQSNPSRGYFFYGKYDSTTKKTTENYKWTLTAPATNTAGIYVYKALSVGNINGTTVGYGVWDNVDITLLYFKDQAVAATNYAYNANGYQFINKAGQGRLYLNDTGTVKNESTNMYYDTSSELWIGYYPVTKTPHFMYLKNTSFTNGNTMVKWSAGEPKIYDEVDKNKYIYTALGYTGNGLVDSQPAGGTTGVGTWGATERIVLSTELVDASMNKDYRYKVGIHNGTTSTYYYMNRYQSELKSAVFVPMKSGNDEDTYISFQRFDNNSTTATLKGEWNTSKLLRDGSSTFYATDMAATNSSGQWHIGVVVDSSADKIINDILTTVEGSALEYSVDGGKEYKPMKQIDDTRWCTDDFASTVKTIHYRWTAYSGEGVNDAVFTYAHDVANGIYFNITE